MQEDYILKGPIKTEEIISLIEYYEKQKAAYLRLIPFPRPDRVVDPELNIGIINPGSSYRTSLQAAIWNREVFATILDPEENGWQFERNSVKRSEGISQGFYSLDINSNLPNKNLHRYPLDYYSTAVLQGKWQKEGLKIVKEAGIKIDHRERGYLTRWDFYYYHQKKKGPSVWLRALTLFDKLIFNRKKTARKF